jgi:hypothetical protein
MRVKLICIKEDSSGFDIHKGVCNLIYHNIYYAIDEGETIYRIEDANKLYLGLVNKKNFMKFADFRQMRIDKILEL